MKKPHECAHEQFAAAVNVHRLLDSGKFMAEVNVRCVDCDEPFYTATFTHHRSVVRVMGDTEEKPGVSGDPTPDDE
jgi:hypothetical protein